MNILIIGMSCGYGGTEGFIISQIRNCSLPDIKIYLLNDMRHEHLSYEDIFKLIGIKKVITPITSEKKHPIKFVKNLQEIYKKNSIEAILINVNTTRVRHILELFAAKLSKVPIRIIHSHNSYDTSLKSKINKIICTPFIKHNLLHLLTNRFACSENAGIWEFKKQPFHIIKNGIETSLFSFSKENRSQLRESLSIKRDTTVFLTVGRVSIQKNTNYLVNAFLKFCKNHKDCILLIVGGIEEKEEEYKKIRNTLELNGKPDSIKILGIRKDISELMSASDIFLLPSIYEGFPIVAIEAQCSGLITILSETITHDVKLTETTQFAPIDKSYEQWITAMDNAYNMTKQKRNRATEVKTISQKGYDIHDSSFRYWNLIKENYTNNKQKTFFEKSLYNDKT